MFMKTELVFGLLDLGPAIYLISMVPGCIYWGLIFVAASHGKRRRWIRDPSLGGPKLTDLKLPYVEDLWRGLTFMRWWVALMFPVLCMSPALFAQSISAYQGDFWNTVKGSVVIGFFPFGVAALATWAVSCATGHGDSRRGD